MKKIILTFCILSASFISAQNHFGGINTSRRVGILNVGINPAELANMSSRYELNVFGFSANVSNNKISFKDIVSGEDLENKMFSGNENTNATVNSQISWPGFAFKIKDWSFAVTTNSFINTALTNFDSNFGRNLAVENNLLITSAAFGSDANQRFNGTTYSELGLSVARKIFEKGDHLINGGLTLKLMAPGLYSNFGAERFSGRLSNYAVNGDVFISGVNNAVLNIAFSEKANGNYDDFSSYTSNLFGGFNGFGTDFGVNYIWKKSDKSYKLKAGFSVRNIGSMTFKGTNNESTNYSLTIPQGTPFSPGLNINVFDNVSTLAQLEQALLAQNGQNGVIFAKISEQKEFKVSLPTVVNLYADYNVTSKFNLTMFMQRKSGNNGDNDQITSENFFSITPRVDFGFFETFVPLSFNEISGTTGGFGLRLGGFYVGSNSILTALISDTKQADLYFGLRIGIL